MIDCAHWSPTSEHAGRCELSLFGGNPSHGVCARHCKQRKPTEKPPAQAFHFAPASIGGLVQLATNYDGNAAAERSRFDGLVGRLHERARTQLAEYRAERPEDLTSRLAYRRWMNGCINATANIARNIEPVPFHIAAQQHGWVIKPDRIVCLSLQSRDDRWKQFTDSCRRSKYLSEWSIERYIATPPDQLITPDFWKNAPSHYATRHDHTQIIQQSHVAGHKWIMVFEDDAIIQDCFDEAFEAAYADLPSDAMALWLTSDGHQSSPVSFSPSLNRSTNQVFLHAYMLNRRGMHRMFSHITACPGQIVDGATQDLMKLEPHFYSTTQNVVIQIGDRGSAAPRSNMYGRRANNVIVPPYHGEFGHMVLWHLRYVHELKADAKIVCCRRGEELLYPSATGFEYDWPELGPDSSRCGHGPPGVAPKREGYRPVVPQYSTWTRWKKFTPAATAVLPAVDVVLGVRKRANPVEARGGEPSRNWPHWQWLAEQLRAAGLTVGIAGHPSVSFDFDVDARAWDHPDGHTAGSVDLLTHCKLYVGTDSGITHLAAMCDAPAIGFRLEGSGPDFMRFAQLLTDGKFVRLSDSGWSDRNAVLAAVMAEIPLAMSIDSLKQF